MIKQTTLALAALVAGVSAQAQDEASALSVTVDVSYVSDYVFRGGQLGQASIQPSVEGSYGDFYAGVWASNPISNDADLSEIDFYTGYGFALTDILSLDVGATYYMYEGGSGDDSIEAFVGVAADVLLSPSLYYYYDFDYDYSTVEASVGYSIPVESVGVSIDLSAAVGVIIPDSDENRTYGSVGVSVPYSLSETATLTVGVDYIKSDSNTFYGGDSDGFVGSAGVSIGF